MVGDGMERGGRCLFLMAWLPKTIEQKDVMVAEWWQERNFGTEGVRSTLLCGFGCQRQPRSAPPPRDEGRGCSWRRSGCNRERETAVGGEGFAWVEVWGWWSWEREGEGEGERGRKVHACFVVLVAKDNRFLLRYHGMEHRGFSKIRQWWRAVEGDSGGSWSFEGVGVWMP